MFRLKINKNQPALRKEHLNQKMISIMRRKRGRRPKRMKLKGKKRTRVAKRRLKKKRGKKSQAVTLLRRLAKKQSLARLMGF